MQFWCVDLVPFQHPHVSLEQFHQDKLAQEHQPIMAIKLFISSMNMKYEISLTSDII